MPTLKAPLTQQIGAIQKAIPEIAKQIDVSAVLLTGSCSRGEATFRSDIDLLFVLNKAAPTYSSIKQWRDLIESKVSGIPLPIQAHFVSRLVEKTVEPAIRMAISDAQILFDPHGIGKKIQELFRHDQSKTGS